VTDFVLGLLALIAGAVLCFRGQLVLRLVIPVWGAFAGFAFGAGLVSGLGDVRFLGTALGWLLGLLFAVVFAILAYLYYAVAVVLAAGAMGFALGSGVVVALGIDWSWVAVLVGLALGLLFGLLAVLADAPMLLLIVMSAAAGAVVVVTGLMLFVGAVDSADFTSASFTDRVDDDWWWYAAAVLLALLGGVSQARGVAVARLRMRDAWVAAGR
jgi:hypothetical protein